MTTETSSTIRTYWTRTIEGYDADGDHVRMVFSVEDCPDFDPEYPDDCEPYTVALRTYRDQDSMSGEPWDFDSESFGDLQEAIERAEEWAAAETEDQAEADETIREGLAGSLEEVAEDAHDDSDEARVIEALAVLIKQGRAGEALKALAAAGLL